MKKLYILFLVVGGIIITAYLFMRFSLQADVRKARAKTGIINKANAAPVKNPDSTMDLRPLFKTRLQQLIKDGSRGLYDLSIDSMSVDVLQSTITLLGVKLSPDHAVLSSLDNAKQAPDDVFKIAFRSLKLDGINIDDVVNDKTMNFRSLEIRAPVIEVYHQKRSYSNKKAIDPGNFYQRIKKHVKKLAIEKLLVESGSVIIYNSKNKNKQTKFNDVVLRFRDILIDSATQHDKDRFLYAKKALMSMRNYATKTADNLYLFKVGTVTIEAPRHIMTLSNITLSSKYKKQRKKGEVYQPELYDLAIPEVLVHHIDWWSLLNRERFVADQVNINDPKLKIFLDRSLPAKPGKSTFLNQLLMKQDLDIYLEKLKVRNLDLTYQEYTSISEQKGSVYFDDVDIKMYHITNMPQYIKQKSQTTINGSGNFMRQVPFTAALTFDLVNYKNGNFSTDFNISGFDGSLVNSFAVPLGLFKVESGKLESVKVHIQGNKYKTTGRIMMLYNDLKLSLYEKEKDENGLDKRGLMGLLANTFVIKNKNPQKNEDPRQPGIEFTPGPEPGFSNLVWKTTLAGILETIGVNPKHASK